VSRLRCWEASPLTRWGSHTLIPWDILVISKSAENAAL
jgi:hypothetical protein